MSAEITDYYCFEIWSYSDSSFTLEVSSDGDKFSLRDASIGACTVARSIREKYLNEPLALQIDLYKSGYASVHFDPHTQTPYTLKQILWTKRAVNLAVYEHIYGADAPPRWVTNLLGAIEYGIAKLIQLCRVGARRAPPPAARPVAPTHAQEAANERLSGLELPVVPVGSNVVPLRPRER